MKKLFALFVAMFSLALVSCGQRGDVTIVYTNDVHTYIANALPKISSQNSQLASYKNYLLNYEKPEGAGRIEIKK